MRGLEARTVVGLLLSIVFHQCMAAAQPFVPIPISNDSGDSEFARIDGRWIAWTDVAYQGGPKNDNDVIAFDLLNNQRLNVAITITQEDAPVISGNTIVWEENGPNLVGRTLPNGGKFPVANGPTQELAGQISGNVVVWHDDRSGRLTIWGRRLDQPAGSDFPISGTAAYDQYWSDVSGNTVVWVASTGNVYGKRLDSGGVFQVAPGTRALFPRISGDWVVWEDQNQIYSKNIVSGAGGLIGSGNRPAIDGDLAVWMEQRGAGKWDITGRHLSTGELFQVTNTPTLDENYPDVSGNVVVWQQFQGIGGRPDIYATTVPEPGGMMVVLGAGLLIGCRKGTRATWAAARV